MTERVVLRGGKSVTYVFVSQGKDRIVRRKIESFKWLSLRRFERQWNLRQSTERKGSFSVFNRLETLLLWDGVIKTLKGCTVDDFKVHVLFSVFLIKFH